MVENVESRDEELVSVLLLVAGQVPGVGPDEVKEFERNVRSDLTGIELNVVWCMHAWECVHVYGWNQELGMISLDIRKMDHNKYYTNSDAKLNNFAYCANASMLYIQYIRYNIILVKKMIKHDCANILSGYQ